MEIITKQLLGLIVTPENKRMFSLMRGYFLEWSETRIFFKEDAKKLKKLGFSPQLLYRKGDEVLIPCSTDGTLKGVAHEDFFFMGNARNCNGRLIAVATADTVLVFSVGKLLKKLNKGKEKISQEKWEKALRGKFIPHEALPKTDDPVWIINALYETQD